MSRAFRILSADSAAEAAIIHAAAFETPWPPSELRRLFKQTTSLAIGAEVGGALVGFICAQVVTDEADILSVAVHPAARRSGHARALLDALHKRLGERGVSRITLDVAADNLAAIGLYEAAGYMRDGVRPGYYKREGAAAVDAVLMSRKFALNR